MRYKVCISYDGFNYYGFQKQKDKCSIQSEIERVLSKIFNESINVIGCSRTDKGVHASVFYFHFDSDKTRSVDKLKISMNKLLNKDIYVRSIEITDIDFHARYSVKSKEYVYLINMGEYNPISRNYVYQYNKSIDVSKLESSASYLIGKHNFKSFTSDDERKDYTRTIYYIKFSIDKDILKISICGDGFLKYMVRNIVGLFIDVNEGLKSVSDISLILSSMDRTKLGKRIESCGLYLNEVNY